MSSAQTAGACTPWHPAIQPRVRSATDPIVGTGLTVGGFWRWAHSDLLDNTTRAVLAEYIVACALIDRSEVRNPWGNHDALMQGSDGTGEIRVEVKSAARLQSWAQTYPSKMVFTRLSGRSWDRATNTMGTKREIRADVFVFAVFLSEDPLRALDDIVDVVAWEFWVVPGATIQERGSRSVSLATVKQIGRGPVAYKDLATAVREMASARERTG